MGAAPYAPMNTLKSIDELCSLLRGLAPGSLIALEGFCGSGKSTLSNKLIECISMSTFHTDDFATKFDRPPPYHDCVDSYRLKDALETRASSHIYIIEGICLRDVLTPISVNPSLFIYVKRLGKNGL
jgi:tRNA A37 threonylcarbamoyladenosine biosynthesis protein TsaE